MSVRSLDTLPDKRARIAIERFAAEHRLSITTETDLLSYIRRRSESSRVALLMIPGIGRASYVRICAWLGIEAQPEPRSSPRVPQQ